MKHAFKLLIISLIFNFISCNNPNKQVEDNIALYTKAWEDVINEGDINQINNKNFTNDVTLVMQPENIVGIEDFKAYYQNFLTGFSETEFTFVDVFGQGDKLVKHWKFTGKHTGDFFGIPPTGQLVDVEGTTLVKMKDGKIAQEQDFMDNMAFMQQLGLVSNPENVAIIDNAYKAFAEGDIPTVLAAMDANIVWNEAEGNAYADGNPYNGPDTILNSVFGRLGNDHEYFKLTDIQLHEMSNNQVLATLRYNAKVKKTGKVYDAQAAHLWSLKDGKIIAFQQYVDTKKLANALGN